jgi:hypothetical protein
MKIIFTEYEYLEQAIESFNKLINNCGYLTVKRVKEICNIHDIKDTDSIYGWRSIDGFKFEHAKFHYGCWELELPEPIILIGNRIDIKGKINGMPISRYIAANLLQYSSLKGEKYYASEDELSEIINDILGSILVIQKQEGTEVKIR